MPDKILNVLWLLLLMPSLAIGQSGPIPATSFGMHENHGATGQDPYPSISFGTFRLWDVDGTLWSDLEPSRGSYNWATLDSWINQLNSRGVTDISYTFGYTPSWCGPSQSLPCTNNQDFVDFITALATRYKGKIKHYEAWNEVTSSTFWTGSMTQLVQIQNDVYKTVKAIDSTATVHTPITGVAANTDCNNSGAGTFSLNNFLAANGTSNFDVVGIHFYPYPFGAAPETLGVMVANAKCAMSTYGISSKPLWNTEFGWGLDTDLPNSTDQAAWVARAFPYMWANGVARSYWYAYDNGAWGTLWTSSGLTAAGSAYQQVYKWMVGATMTSKCAISGSFYTCGLTLANGHQALIVWLNVFKSTNTQSYTPPSQYDEYHDLAGNTITISSGQSVTIGEKPIMFEDTATTATVPTAPTGLTATVN